MARTTGISETDSSALKKTLFDQQQLLQKLYIELDAEREASATAANEALSMILRLQGEKAAVEMEASQYKRIAEEKICHVEHSLKIFEHLIYHKEVEITSLEFQVQAYRYKLLSLGWTDVGVNDKIFPENLFPLRCDLSNGDMGFNQNVRRMSSLPAIYWKDACQKKGIVKSISGVPSPETSPIIIEECFDSETSAETCDVEKKSGNNSMLGELDSYWEQIRRLDSRVKEITKSKCPPLEDEYVNSCSICSCMSAPVNFSCSLGRENMDVSDEIGCDQNYPYNASICSKNVVQDIFEVSQNEESYKTQVKERSKSISKADYENLGSYMKDQRECIKKTLSSSNLEARPPRPGDHRKKEADSLESQLDLQHLIQRIERLQKASESQGMNEIIDEGLGKKELNLLEEIRQQLNSIQNEMRCWRTKEEPPPDETPMITLMEAMLHFWL